MNKAGHRPYNGKNMARAICFIFAGLFASLTVAAAESRLQIRSVVRADARSGRLVRTSVVKRAPAVPVYSPVKPPVQPMPEAGVTPVEQVSPSVTDVGALVNQAAATHGVDAALVHSVISVESGFNPLAVSLKGAQGLMQLIPATARRFGVTDSFDARQNIEAGVKYLRYLQEMFKDDRLALAAYNAGEGAVTRYGGIPPYRETEQYVEKVGRKLNAVRRNTPAASAAAPKPTEAAAAADPGPEPIPLRALESFTDESGLIHFVTREVAVRKTIPRP